MAAKPAMPRPWGRARPLRTQNLTPLLILNLYLVGVYTNIFIYRGDNILIPNVFALAAATLMFITSYRQLVSHPLLRLAALLAFLAAFTLVGGSGWAMLPTRATSFLQMASALLAAHLALIFMGRFPAPALRRLFFYWMAAIVAGTVLETLGPLRPLSDAFRQLAFAKAWLYEAPIRDIEVYGAVRPNLFTQEPSHVAKAFAAFATGWYLLSRHRLRTVLLASLTAVEVVALRSPFVLLAMPVVAVADRLVAVRREEAAAAALKTVGLALLLFAAALLLATLLFPGRWETIAAGNDLSMYMRFYGPFVTAGMVLADFPLFGIGLGAKEYLWPYLRESYGIMGTDRYLSTIYLNLSGNGVANALMFFGLAGFGAFWWLVWRYYRAFSLPAAVVGTMLVFIFFNLEGAIEGARLWGYVTICLAGFLVARRRAMKQSKASMPHR